MMKLKKLLEGFAWERKAGQPLPTMKDVARNHKVNERDFTPGDRFGGQDSDTSDFDYKYFKGQVESLETTLQEFEQEIATSLETIADDSAAMGSISAGQARNQASRYIQGADKQLEGLRKMLDRLERKGEF